MKRFTTMLGIMLLFATAALAQEKPPEDYNTIREFQNRIFDVHNRDPRVIASAIRALGSGFKGTRFEWNNDLRTITVRDFPENIAAMDEAIKRLDRPAPPTPNLEFKISVLIGSKTASNDGSVPEDLAPVVKQLQATLRYAHYGLMVTTVHRTKPGDGIEGSGVAEPTLLGMTAHEGTPILYTYRLANVSIAASERPSVDIERFSFSMRIPITVGSGGVQYQSVGFDTPVTVRQNEKVVIGTTTMGDKALIVVVTANVESK